MGTQFEYAVNLVAGSRAGDAFPCCGLDERGYPRNGNQEGMGSTSSARTPGSMDEPASENSLESVRRKMQMQEDIFRKQVRELHRLYGIQKKLMGELKKEMEQSRLPSIMRGRHTDFINWPHQTATGHTLHLQRLNDERGSRERSASSSAEAARMSRGLDLEIRPLKRGEEAAVDGELSCPSFVPPVRRDAPQVDDGLNEETDVELTLTIGGRSGKRKSSNCSHRHREQDLESSKKKHSSASITSDHGDASNSNTSNMGGSSTTSDQEKKRPHWLFRVQ